MNTYYRTVLHVSAGLFLAAATAVSALAAPAADLAATAAVSSQPAFSGAAIADEELNADVLRFIRPSAVGKRTAARPKMAGRPKGSRASMKPAGIETRFGHFGKKPRLQGQRQRLHCPDLD